MNRSPNTRGLRKGNTENVGRKPAAATYRRERVLERLRETISSVNPGKTIFDDAVESVGHLIAERDGPTVRWFFDQQIGTARTTEELFFANEEVIAQMFSSLYRAVIERTGQEGLFDEVAERMKVIYDDERGLGADALGT